MSLQAYDSYRKSNLEWLDEVPDHWEHKKIAWDLPYVVGWTPPSGKDEFYDGKHPWVTIADMTRGNIEDTQSKITDAAIDAKKAEIVPAGSMLFSFKLSVGKVAFLKIDSYTNEAIAAFRPTSGISLEFWKYAAPEIIPHYGRENIYGAKLLNQELIGSARFYCPPVEEQTQIARFLDHETAKIDALIREQERLIELLQEKRQAVISHAVTKGLDPDVPMKESGVEWLGEVPEHWIVARIKNFARIESGHTPDKKKEEYWVDCDIPWVSLNDSKQLKKADYIADTSTKVNDLGIANSSARLLPKEAVVFTRDASIGLSAITTKPMAVSQHLIAWLCAKEKLVPEYLLLIFYAMESEFERYTFGATIKTIGMDDVRSLTAAFPPMEEQKQLVAWAFRKKETLRAGLDAAEKTILLLKERRSALISAAVTGKIDVRNWQPPTDESAFDEEVRTVGMEATA